MKSNTKYFLFLCFQVICKSIIIVLSLLNNLGRFFGRMIIVGLFVSTYIFLINQGFVSESTINIISIIGESWLLSFAFMFSIMIWTFYPLFPFFNFAELINKFLYKKGKLLKRKHKFDSFAGTCKLKKNKNKKKNV